MMSNVCPVCNKYHFEEENAFEECPICGWVDDLVQRKNPDYEKGYNQMSLNKAKEAFEKGQQVI